jgi:uncharacterized alkaline shock family protein YloU
MTYVRQENDGAITVSDAALTQIVVQAAEGVEGARVRRRRRRLELEIEDGEARVRLELAVAYGRVLPDVARSVQERVAGALERMCGLDVAAVDVSVEELDR